MDVTQLVAYHQGRREEAEWAYRDLLEPDFESEAWRTAVSDAEALVAETLAATAAFADVEGALRQSGKHAYVLRFFMGPPLSQDQFRLACRQWPKASETSGRPLSPAAARATAEAFAKWRDTERVVPILEGGSTESRRAAVSATVHMMAVNCYRTVRRMRLAHQQEQEVLELLLGLGYRQRRAELVDEPGALAEGEFMHATQFKTADGSTHEVDVAIGLPKRTILALECKVSNDATNSVKRVNDVLKKATAWKKQWGQFVVTGALLQGVFSAKEPRRLLEEGVVVFWSHRLDELREWLAA